MVENPGGIFLLIYCTCLKDRIIYLFIQDFFIQICSFSVDSAFIWDPITCNEHGMIRYSKSIHEELVTHLQVRSQQSSQFSAQNSLQMENVDTN